MSDEQEYQIIEVGDKVRSYDHERIRDSYVEGVVEAVGDVDAFDDCARYTIKVERYMMAGKDVTQKFLDHNDNDPYVYPPVNGTLKLFGGICHGVEKIEDEA